MPATTTTENLETVKGLYESFAGGDIEAIRGMMDPDIELQMPSGFADGGTFHGYNEIVNNVFARQGKVWENVSVVPARYVADGDTVIALIKWRGTSIETGKSVAFEGAHVFDFEDDKIVQWTSYADTALFNAALEE